MKNKEIITVSLVLLLVIVIIGVSYAAFTFSKTGVTENAITTSAVTMIYTEVDNQISINNAVPITEEVGKTLSDENYVFDFTINIKTGPRMPISYEVTAVKDASSTMGNEDVRLYLQKSLDGTNYNDEVLEPSPYTPLDVDDEFGAKARMITYQELPSSCKDQTTCPIWVFNYLYDSIKYGGTVDVKRFPGIYSYYNYGYMLMTTGSGITYSVPKLKPDMIEYGSAKNEGSIRAVIVINK